MKFRLTGKQLALSITLLLSTLGAAVVAFLPGTDPMLREIASYSAPLSDQEADMKRQLADIQAGLGVDTPNAQGYTPLMNAVQLNDTGIIDFLLIKGARLQPVTPLGKTAAKMTVARQGLCQIAPGSLRPALHFIVKRRRGAKGEGDAERVQARAKRGHSLKIGIVTARHGAHRLTVLLRLEI